MRTTLSQITTAFCSRRWLIVAGAKKQWLQSILRSLIDAARAWIHTSATSRLSWGEAGAFSQFSTAGNCSSLLHVGFKSEDRDHHHQPRRRPPPPPAAGAAAAASRRDGQDQGVKSLRVCMISGCWGVRPLRLQDGARFGDRARNGAPRLRQPCSSDLKKGLDQSEPNWQPGGGLSFTFWI